MILCGRCTVSIYSALVERRLTDPVARDILEIGSVSPSNCSLEEFSIRQRIKGEDGIVIEGDIVASGLWLMSPH